MALSHKEIIMADEPFPIPEPEPTPTAIGDREWTFIIPATDTPYAKYSIQILDQDDEVIEVKNGVLFKAGGVDHLRPADKQALIAMDTYLKGKAEVAWLP